MTFNADEVFQLTATIWDAMLGLTLERESSGATANYPRSTASCIQITGAWNGAILLDCPVDIARQAAAIMFSRDIADVTVSDLQDAVAELVNMIGGNFKALLPETCYLSLPAVVEGGDYSTRIPGSKVLGRLAFNCQGHAMSIAVLERIADRAQAA
jgi:chemotaxis protein CheX